MEFHSGAVTFDVFPRNCSWYQILTVHWWYSQERQNSWIDLTISQRSVKIPQSVECLFCHILWCSSIPDPGLMPHQYLCASMWKKWLSCHAGHQEISRCHTRGEFEEFVAHTQRSTQTRESTLALKPRTDVTRGPKQKDLYKSQNNQNSKYL